MLLFGWKMGVSNFILGGKRGYSGGKESRARKKPPAEQQLAEATTPVIRRIAVSLAAVEKTVANDTHFRLILSRMKDIISTYRHKICNHPIS